MTGRCFGWLGLDPMVAWLGLDRMVPAQRFLPAGIVVALSSSYKLIENFLILQIVPFIIN